MALAKSQSQITWSAANSLSVSQSSSGTSDSQSISDTAVQGGLTFKADNDGTPAAGDEVVLKILYTDGDPDADPDSSDEYGTAENGVTLAVVDTNAEDPGIVSIPIDVSHKAFKVYADNQSSGRAITVSAQYNEQTDG